ncbi:MAG TPA: hypothetical protein VF625_18065 [Longimicrobium sp.]
MIRRVLLAAALLVGAGGAAAQDTLSGGGVSVVHQPRHRALAREVLTVARRPLPLPGFAPAAAPDSTTIILAADEAMWSEATGGLAPEWAGGVAFPHDRLIVLPVYPAAAVRPSETGTVLRHELAHVLLQNRVPGTIPRWFAEGYAEVAAGGWDTESAWQLRMAFLTGRAPPLDSLTLGWPRGAEDARLAYLLSATAVEHLRRRAGEDGFALLMANWRRDGSLERAVRNTFGMTMGQLEDEWRADARKRYGWLLMLSNAAIVWLIATALVLAAWIPRRRRNRRKMEEMRAEERMLPPPRPAGFEVDYPIAEPPPAHE